MESQATEIVIKIGIWEILGIVVAGGFIVWRASARFTKVETLIDGIKERLTRIEGSSSGAFGQSSPINLLPKGQELLEKSGLKQYIDDNKDSLLDFCRQENKMDTAYDVQKAAFQLFDTMKFSRELETKLKKTAYDFGVDMNLMRRVGGIYLRDICLGKLNMSQEEIDHHTPTTEQ